MAPLPDDRDITWILSFHVNGKNLHMNNFMFHFGSDTTRHRGKTHFYGVCHLFGVKAREI